jgi:hypothetical protein
MRVAALAALVALSGCTIYFGDDDSGDDGCLGPPAQELRDPQSGQCTAFGGGCGPQPDFLPDWASCGGPCEGLDQPSCEATAGCRAILIDECPECDALVLSYAACWGIAPSGPATGECYGLDAQTCSEHEDCEAVHLGVEAPAGDGGFTNSVGQFEYCQPEQQPAPFTCGDLTCAPGQYCGVEYPGIPDAPVQYTCNDFGACSGDTTCSCLQANGACADDCTYDSAGDLTVSCYRP